VHNFGEGEVSAGFGPTLEEFGGSGSGAGPEPSSRVAVPWRRGRQQRPQSLVDPRDRPLVEAPFEEVDSLSIIPIGRRVGLGPIDRWVAADEEDWRAGDMAAPRFGEMEVVRTGCVLGVDDDRLDRQIPPCPGIADRWRGQVRRLTQARPRESRARVVFLWVSSGMSRPGHPSAIRWRTSTCRAEGGGRRAICSVYRNRFGGGRGLRVTA
jgi:hypothetical protein